LAVLKKYNLEIYKDYKVKELSLGTKRKTALICSSLVDWQLLVMDEPISGIDVDGKAELANMIEAIDINNRILIIITHDFDFLDKVSYHKLIIRDGQLHEDSCS
jgi:energy-coupling factor transport system ATP-binding protein